MNANAVDVFNIPVEEPEIVSMPARKQASPLTPRNMTEAMEFARMIANSDFVPKDYRGKPGNILVAVQWGYEIGLGPMQAMQNISIINGRPSVWGDAMLAIVQASPVYDWVKEQADQDGATCTVKRKGEEPHTVQFTVDDAKKANLWGKQGPWTQYPKRMLQMRARGFALRDKFADVLKGLIAAEEAMDYPPEKGKPPLTAPIEPEISPEDKETGRQGYIKAMQEAETLDELREIKDAARGFALQCKDREMWDEFKNRAADMIIHIKDKQGEAVV